MSALVVDTSSWVSYFAGRGSDRIDEALALGQVYVTPVVVAELCSGRMKPKDRTALVDLLNTLPLCETPFEHWVRVGELRSTLLGKGLSVSTPDAHVAQCALDLGATLLSEDAIFKKLARQARLTVAS